MNDYELRKAADAQTADFDWGSLHWYASGAMGNSDHLTVGRCIIKPGQRNPGHYHPDCEEVLHVLAGRIDHYVDGVGMVPMGVGDTITIAPNVNHHARNTGQEDAHLLICFSTKARKTVGE